MNNALAELGSDDVLTQNEGVAGVIGVGKTAVPPLLQLLEKGLPNRSQVMYALSQIGDVRAVEAFRAGLLAENEQVRAYAAQGLAHVGDPKAMAACLQTINDAADELHLDITPSVRALGQMGLRAVPSLLDLLMHDDEITRLHAQRALELIVAWRATLKAAEEMRREWHENGDYDYSADAETRAISVTTWRKWLKEANE